MVALDFRFGGDMRSHRLPTTLSRCAALPAQAQRRSIRSLPGCSVRLEHLPLMNTTEPGLEPLIGVEELAEYLGSPRRPSTTGGCPARRREPSSSASICGSRSRMSATGSMRSVRVMCDEQTTHEADEHHGARDAQDAPTPKEVLTGVLANSGGELSATQTIKAEQEAWGSIAQLAAEMETLATAAQCDRWAQLLMSCGLTDEQRDDVLASDAYGPLAAELRRAEANGHNIEATLPSAVARY